ncbi:MAG: bifunctional ornithine acetyltransferase/N-acetylglutamate synthase [Rhodobiaceae bacterium]|nr:bifunctional ornithine acetyltransferase/N-acetylglutamate synthase [Rhodobiaceae bacterium]|tara:strand:- start:7890 stop:9107 length:1218 start_codon:yes stop_codon:yes gene_type:complete
MTQNNSKNPINDNEISGLSIYTFVTNAHYKKRKDLLLIVFDDLVNYAGLYTKSSCPSIPVQWCKKNLSQNTIKAILVNSGNANAFTGIKGHNDLIKILAPLSSRLGCQLNEIAVASTGVIGEFLNTDPIIEALSDEKVKKLSNWDDAAYAIMTTDTYPKLSFTKSSIDGHEIKIVGIAKGSGMIEPNMGTMLAFIFTDANVTKQILSILLRDITNNSFNSITVDGETSTSDTVLLFSTNKANHKIVSDIETSSINYFRDDLEGLAIKLAQQIVRDGEGATKLIEIHVTGASTKNAAMRISKSIANSPLVKTALYGEDPNWGRVIAAIGKSYEKIDLEKLELFFGDHQITKNGSNIENYDESLVKKYMKNERLIITINLGIGCHEHKVWTCDLSHKYIDINTDYRS